MKKITIQSTHPISNPHFVKTEMISAIREDGVSLKWERILGHDSVHILVDNIETEELLLVQQVRIPVLVNDPESGGIVTEACAGLVDKDTPIDVIVAEEVQEELGYNPEEVTFLKCLKSSVGNNGSNAYLFKCEVTEADKIDFTGGLHEEDIEIVRIPYNEVYKWFSNPYQVTDATTIALLMHWHIENNLK